MLPIDVLPRKTYSIRSIPEPGSVPLFLLGMAGAAVALRRRRRRRRAARGAK